jgi:hypothetical protein
MSIGILQIAQGKTVSSGGSGQYGHFLRSKNVLSCPFGALGFYLFQRFENSGEMLADRKRPNFADNKQWFGIKLMTDGSGSNTKASAKDLYVKPIRKCFKWLRIYASHFGHWG